MGLFTPANAPADSTNKRTKQRRAIPALPDPESGISVADWRARLVREGHFKAVEVVDGDLGPIGLMGSPRVCLGDSGGSTWVWLERRPWGWSNANQAFVGRNRVRAAIYYAMKLAEAIRKAAMAEQARRERLQAATLREKFGGAL